MELNDGIKNRLRSLENLIENIGSSRIDEIRKFEDKPLLDWIGSFE
jgi:hypothetical protein